MSRGVLAKGVFSSLQMRALHVFAATSALLIMPIIRVRVLLLDHRRTRAMQIHIPPIPRQGMDGYIAIITIVQE